MSDGPHPSFLKVDLHLHSEYSPDSSTSLESLIARCRELGLDRIALTDHNTAEGALRLCSWQKPRREIAFWQFRKWTTAGAKPADEPDVR